MQQTSPHDEPKQRHNKWSMHAQLLAQRDSNHFRNGTVMNVFKYEDVSQPSEQSILHHTRFMEKADSTPAKL